MKNNNTAKIFKICIATLLIFMSISYTIEYWLTSDKSYAKLALMFYVPLLFIYSFLYAQINRIHKFSTRYAIVFNCVVGTFFIINSLTFHLKNFNLGFYLIFIFFLLIQLIITLYCKKNAQH